MTCGVVERFLYSMMLQTDGPEARLWVNKDRPYTDQRVELPSEQPDTIEPLTQMQRDLVRLYIWNMYRVLTYTLDDTIEYDAITKQIGEVHIIDSVIKIGYRSVIKISKKLYDELAAAYEHPTDVPNLLWMQTKFAVMLVHENMHAYSNAIFGKLDREPYFGNAAVAEVGFEIEKRLFGGRMATLYDAAHVDKQYDVHVYEHNGIPSKLRGVLILWEYPSQGLLEEYGESGSMGLRVPREELRP